MGQEMKIGLTEELCFFSNGDRLSRTDALEVSLSSNMNASIQDEAFLFSSPSFNASETLDFPKALFESHFPHAALHIPAGSSCTPIGPQLLPSYQECAFSDTQLCSCSKDKSRKQPDCPTLGAAMSD